MSKFFLGLLIFLSFTQLNSAAAFNLESKENPFDFKGKIILPSDGVVIFSPGVSSLKIMPETGDKKCGDYFVYNGDKMIDSGFILESSREINIDNLIFTLKCQEEDILVVIE